MDKWAGSHDEEVVIQTGYSCYEPQNCRWSRLYPYWKIKDLAEEARLVISHGGPSSFILPLYFGRIPIVVPRKAGLGEHVNDHQAEFCRELEKRWGNIIVVGNIADLGDVIDRYYEITKNMRTDFTGNNEEFCRGFEKIAKELCKI